jgi:hypothetical protein
MRINLSQQLAVQTKLDALMGRCEFDRLCAGMPDIPVHDQMSKRPEHPCWTSEH